MAYPVRTALFQWQNGERRLRELDEPERRRLERRVSRVMDELRRRLGSTFTVEELADFYGDGTSWADELAGSDSTVIDAAFGRYAREAKNFAGGRVRAAG
jgi:DNA-directed RNA polymerase specialized sigma subunit